MSAVPAVAIEKAIYDVLRMRVLEKGRYDGGQFGAIGVAHETKATKL